MRRWNGWGDEDTSYPLPESAVEHLVAVIGEGDQASDIPLENILAALPTSTLTPHPLVTTNPEKRVRHSRGQSLPDWIALRSGRINRFTDGVAYPTSDTDVRSLLDYAHQSRTTLIPYGGGTSVVGHINPLPGDNPTLTVDLSCMDKLIAIDKISQLATFEAGVCGPFLETQLNSQGYTLGHYPQSFELSTLGGWIATRSTGQQSYHYGRIEDLFAGGHVETPTGPLDLPPFPASAAGPDLRQLILGSEGRFGIITRAIVRIRSLPEADDFFAVFFRDWESGVAAVRNIAQDGAKVSMLRLSDAQETDTTLALSGKKRLAAWAQRGLDLLGYRSGRCLLIFGVTGTRKSAKQARRQVMETTRAHGGLPTGQTIGKMWAKNRFLAPYLRNSLWEHGYALDTLETAVPWSAILPTAAAIKKSIQNGILDNTEAVGTSTNDRPKVLVFSHLSHVYTDGASIYTTYIYPRSADPDETLHYWQILKAAASQVIVDHGGTISHQHGVGYDHLPYLSAEKGQVGMSMLEATRKVLDPEGVLNPGKLLV